MRAPVVALLTDAVIASWHLRLSAELSWQQIEGIRDNDSEQRFGIIYYMAGAIKIFKPVSTTG